jgi:hypothetical protein
MKRLKSFLMIAMLFLTNALYSQSFYSQHDSPLGTVYDSYQLPDQTIVVYGSFEQGSIARIEPTGAISYDSFPEDTVISMANYQGIEYAVTNGGNVYQKEGGFWVSTDFPKCYKIYSDTIFNALYLFSKTMAGDTLSSEIRKYNGTLEYLRTMTPFVAGASHADGMLWLGLGGLKDSISGVWTLDPTGSTHQLYALTSEDDLIDMGEEFGAFSIAATPFREIVQLHDDYQSIIASIYYEDQCNDVWIINPSGIPAIVNGDTISSNPSGHFNGNLIHPVNGEITEITPGQVMYANGYVTNDIYSHMWEITPLISVEGDTLSGDTTHCENCSIKDWIDSYYRYYNVGNNIVIVADGAVRMAAEEVMTGTSTVYINDHALGYQASTTVVWFGNMSEITSVHTESYASINVFPNPSNSSFHFPYDTYEIFDITGKRLITFTSDQLEVSQWNPGSYILKSSNNVTTQIIVM